MSAPSQSHGQDLLAAPMPVRARTQPLRAAGGTDRPKALKATA